MKEKAQCIDYLGVACIDGMCPKVSSPSIENCEDCHFYGGCEDCYFKGTKFCDKSDTEFKGVVIHENTPDLYD